MGVKRVKSNRYTGVYVRENTCKPPRMFRGKPDCYYEIIYRDEMGKTHCECAGKKSEGMTEQAASELRSARLAVVWKKKQQKKHGYVPGLVAAMVKENAPSMQDFFSELAHRYFLWMNRGGKYGDKEKNRYEKHIHGLIGEVPASEIDWSIAEHVKHSLTAVMAPASAKKCLSLCSAIFSHHNFSGNEVLPNPFSKRAGFKMPRVENQCERYLQPSEASLLLDALKKRSLQLHDMSYISLHTGLRATEIFNLRGSDIESNRNIIYVTGKGGKRVPLPTGQDVMEILLRNKRGSNDFLFAARNGEKIKQISDTFLRVAEDIGLSPVSTEFNGDKWVAIKRTPKERVIYQRQKVWFHTLRHTFASWLALSGKFTLYELQIQLRHDTIQMTERYAHFIPESIREPSQHISEFLIGTSNAIL